MVTDGLRCIQQCEALYSIVRVAVFNTAQRIRYQSHGKQAALFVADGFDGVHIGSLLRGNVAEENANGYTDKE